MNQISFLMVSVNVPPVIEKLVKILLRIPIGTGVLHPSISLFSSLSHMFFFLSTNISVTGESKVFLGTHFLYLVFVLLAWVNAEF